MSFSTVLPYLLSGISVGGQYALIAIGYTMVYGILRLINFAHGDVFMVSGILMVYLNASGLPLYISPPQSADKACKRKNCPVIQGAISACLVSRACSLRSLTPM